MRTSSLRSLSLGTLGLAATMMAAPAGAQSRPDQRPLSWPGSMLDPVASNTSAEPIGPQRDTASRQPGSLDAVTGTRAPAIDIDVLLPQDSDYSVRGMFSELHGDFLQRSRRYEPEVQVLFGAIEDTSTGDEVGKVNYQEMQIDARILQPIDPDTYLVLGGGYGVRRYDFSQPVSSTARVKDTDLHRISADLGVGHFLSEDTLIEAVFRPGIYSDLSGEPDSGDWQFFGDVLATWEVFGKDAEQPLFLKAGVRVDQTFSETPIYPLLGFSWLGSDQVRVDVLLPEEIRMSWMPSAEWIFSGALDLHGALYQYRMNNLTPTPGNARLDARVQELRLYVDGTYRFSDQASVFGRFGSVLTGKYDWQGVGGGPNADWDGAIDPTVFFEIGFGWNF